jgi:hypothetical protein
MNQDFVKEALQLVIDAEKLVPLVGTQTEVEDLLAMARQALTFALEEK